MTFYTQYGDFKSNKEFRDYLGKLDTLREEEKANEWMLLQPPNAFAIWRAEGYQVYWVKPKGGDHHWMLTCDQRGRWRVKPDATWKDIERIVRRKTAGGFDFTLELTLTPPDEFKSFAFDDPVIVSIRDKKHKHGVEQELNDPRICINMECTQPGVQLINDDDRPWYWYMLCDEHRTDVLDPCNPSVSLQTTVRRRGRPVHINHRVRQNQRGGTPGPTLCGLERFGPDAQIKGFNVGGGVMGGDNIETCEACVQGDLELRQSAEFLDRRVRWLERQSRKDQEVWSARLEGVNDAFTRAADERDRERERREADVTTLSKQIIGKNKALADLETRLHTADTLAERGAGLAEHFLCAYDRVMTRLNEFDAEFISRFIGYTEAAFENALIEARRIHETE